MDRVNRGGNAFLSATRLRERAVLRLAIGNLKTTEGHVARAWQLLQQGLASLLEPSQD
jgi:aromatic-L-amino-acid decarboxylase